MDKKHKYLAPRIDDLTVHGMPSSCLSGSVAGTCIGGSSAGGGCTTGAALEPICVKGLSVGVTPID
ncbi:MAG: hypothetical protein Q8N14_07420 [Candidatus Omnitrophota bacterium]|nr:hypothetical protein [Candidatus Omnitrophota bacterium]